jgi:hypothetical protein
MLINRYPRGRRKRSRTEGHYCRSTEFQASICTALYMHNQHVICYNKIRMHEISALQYSNDDHLMEMVVVVQPWEITKSTSLWSCRARPCRFPSVQPHTLKIYAQTHAALACTVLLYGSL